MTAQEEAEMAPEAAPEAGPWRWGAQTELGRGGNSRRQGSWAARALRCSAVLRTTGHSSNNALNYEVCISQRVLHDLRHRSRANRQLREGTQPKLT